MAPASEVGAIQANSRQLIRPARAWVVAAVVAATSEIARLAPAPAAGDEASRMTSGGRRFPRTSPTNPPAAETANDQSASAISSSASTRRGILPPMTETGNVELLRLGFESFRRED
jgi:hypothetical protein